MSEVKPPPQMKTNRKPKWVLDHEAKAKALKSEVKAEDKKVHDATDMFRRSKDWKTIHVSENRKEGKRKEKIFRVIKEEGTKSKRRRDSSEEEEEDADAPARKTLTPSKRPLSHRSSSSPQSLTMRYDAVTSAAAKPKKVTEVIALDSNDSDDDDDDIYLAPPPRKTTKPEPKQSMPSQDDDSDTDPDGEFLEMKRKIREKAKQQENEKRRRDSEIQSATGLSGSKSPTEEEGPNPPIQILIDPRIPDSQPLMVTRKWNQRFREVRNAWCEHQGFVADFADTVIFMWRGCRVFDVASCRSLGIKLDEEGEPILSGINGIDEDGSNLVVVATTQSILEEERKAATKEARRKEDEANGITAEPPPAPEKQKVRIMLNAKDHATHKLIVQEDTTFERIANNFRATQKIPDQKQITLMWDGEVLEPSDTIKDTEIEDMESIEVHIK